MRRCLLLFLSVLPLLLLGCNKGHPNLTGSSLSPTPVVQATPTPSDTNRTAKFIVLLYHRFEDRPAELVITPNDFRAQMQALKDNRISVISMQDLLAWRKGLKAIPSKSAVITLDDEWNSQYYVAWPIMKEFGYPFTLFVYTQWVNTGGKAMTWAQLEEMRDAGVDVEAHTVSHHDLRHAPRGQDYTAWLSSKVRMFFGPQFRRCFYLSSNRGIRLFLNPIVAKGGKVKQRECERPCQGIGSVCILPGLPRLPPP